MVNERGRPWTPSLSHYSLQALEVITPTKDWLFGHMHMVLCLISNVNHNYLILSYRVSIFFIKDHMADGNLGSLFQTKRILTVMISLWSHINCYIKSPLNYLFYSIDLFILTLISLDWNCSDYQIYHQIGGQIPSNYSHWSLKWILKILMWMNMNLYSSNRC